MDPNLFPSLNDGSVTERAVQLLSELITSGKIPAGEFLPSEPALSKQLGISRGTIRMALKTLEMRGLVVTRRGIGVEVANRTREVAIDSLGMMLQHGNGSITDAFEMRTMLEGQSAMLAAERVTDADLDEIAAALERIEEPGISIDEQIDRDLALHLRICEAARNPILVALAAALRNLLRDVIATTLTVRTLYEPDGPRLPEHLAILDAIRARDPNRAHDAMTEHMRRSIARARAASG
jgi:DNA-binding FadR family transcriptional regulator